MKELLEIMKDHREHDRLVSGKWLQKEKVNGLYKGCFYGCAMQTEDKPIESACEKYGIPEWLGHWSEAVFENLPENEAFDFPVELLERMIKYTGDFGILKHKLAVKRLTFLSELNTAVDCFDTVIECHKKAIKGVVDIDWLAAWSAVESAESAAWSREKEWMFGLLEE